MFLTPDQLADRWQKNVRTLAQMRWRGEGPAYVKIGGAVRYPLEAVEAHEEAALHQPRPAA